MLENGPISAPGPSSEEGSESLFRTLRWGAFVTLASAFLILAGLNLLEMERRYVVGVDAAVCLIVGVASELILRFVRNRLRSKHEEAKRLWISRAAEFEAIAARDDLTQLYNRRYLYSRLAQELGTAESRRQSFSILMMDVDDLKLINDEFGHHIGDTILKKFACVLADHAGERDVVARLGGDEFGILMAGADHRKAEFLTGQLSAALAAVPIHETENASIYLGVSIGASGYPWGGTNLEEIMHWADMKLYANKLERKGITGRDGRAEHTLVSAIVEVLSSALDIKDWMTHRHARRVSRLSVALANRLRLSEHEVQEVEHGARLHDIGKIGVADHILRKPAPLSDEEWLEMRRHPEHGYEILKGIDFLRDAADVVYAHHERFDGSGYPRGLAGHEIPLGARIFAVVDAFDAMTSRRPYRDGMPRQAAMLEIAQNAGTQFDPQIVEAFLNMIRSAEFYQDEGDEYGMRVEAPTTERRRVPAAKLLSVAPRSKE